MKISKAFVTGGTGFIGTRLIKQLIDNGTEVTCLVRNSKTSDKQRKTKSLEELGCRLVHGDLMNDALKLPNVTEYDTLFHVAATKNTANPQDLLTINPSTTKNLLDAILRTSATPRIVGVSSLAACGPSKPSQPTIETDPNSPVSFYGRSKLLSEQVLASYADRLPISIVRPPIVLGQGDANAFRMFKLIQNFNCHFIPGLTDRQYSVIHVDDLVNGMICVACQGQSMSTNQAEDSAAIGTYFATTNQLSYADLGQSIGLALGRPQVRNLYIPRTLFWSVGAVNAVLARVTNRPRFLNLDKYREAVAGDWICSAAKLVDETDFGGTVSFRTRLEQTVQWYRQHGWLSNDASSQIYPSSNSRLSS